MLNSDICLQFNIDGTPKVYPGGQNQCIDDDAERQTDAQYIHKMIRGGLPEFRLDNDPFYWAFADAWRKAKTAGQSNVSPLTETCKNTS